MGLLEPACSEHGAGESTFLASKQLCFDQCFRQAGAIHANEWAVRLLLSGARAQPVLCRFPVLLESSRSGWWAPFSRSRHGDLVLNIDQGSSGVLLASIKSVRGAKTYDVRFGPVGAGGATPPSWSMKTVAKIKPPVAIDGLTPGATYAIQVRAYGPLGHTEWSDSATRMCI